MVHVVDEACNMTVSSAMQAIGPDLSRENSLMPKEYAPNLPREICPQPTSEPWTTAYCRRRSEAASAANQIDVHQQNARRPRPRGQSLHATRWPSLGEHLFTAHFPFLYLNFGPGYAQAVIHVFHEGDDVKETPQPDLPCSLLGANASLGHRRSAASAA